MTEPTMPAMASDTRQLTQSKLLDGLPDEIIRSIEAACHWHDCPAGTTILDAKDRIGGVYFITRGTVRLVRRLSGNRTLNYAEFHAGDGFGELSIIDGGGRAADAITTTPATYAVCPREVFLDLVCSRPELTRRILEKLAQIIRAADRRIADLAGMTPMQRVYAELVRLSSPDVTRPGIHRIGPAPLHRDIANWAATTTDVVARAIAQLMKAGLLERQGMDLVLTDSPRIQALAQAESLEP